MHGPSDDSLEAGLVSAANRTQGDERTDSARATLTRALASESRSALARVELAASELARSGLAPALGGRVATIREAVTELDALLGKIDLLSDLDRVPDRAAVDLARVARSVVQRLSPGLRARGVELVWEGGGSRDDGLAVGVPQPTVELLCLGLVRLVVGAVSPGAARLASAASPRNVRVGAELRGDDVCLVARCSTDGTPARFDRTARLELEVVLAEWAGAFLAGEDSESIEVGIALPARPNVGIADASAPGAPA